MGMKAFPAEVSPPDPDAALVFRAKGGDLAAFSQLVRLHQGYVRSFLAVRMGGVDDADDLAQEAFVTAHRKLGSFEPGKPFRPWLRGIARHLLLNHRRKFRAQPVGGNEELELMMDNGLEEAFGGGQEPAILAALRECLEKVEGPSRALIVSRYLEGKSVLELQESTGRGYSALTMQLHRIRCSLASCIETKVNLSQNV